MILNYRQYRFKSKRSTFDLTAGLGKSKIFDQVSHEGLSNKHQLVDDQLLFVTGFLPASCTQVIVDVITSSQRLLSFCQLVPFLFKNQYTRHSKTPSTNNGLERIASAGWIVFNVTMNGNDTAEMIIIQYYLCEFLVRSYKRNKWSVLLKYQHREYGYIFSRTTAF